MLGGNVCTHRLLLVFNTDDRATMKRLLDLGKDGWGPAAGFYRFRQIQYLKLLADDHALEALRASVAASPDNIPHLDRSFLAAASGDVDVALEEFYLALEGREQIAIGLQKPMPETRRLFASLYEDPRYQEMLRRYGLDDTSLAAITVPPLPFLEDVR